MASVPAFDSLPERLTSQVFFELFGRIEHETLDFKRGVPADILDTIPAMAMTHGGLIVHGVDDQRTISGCPLSQHTHDRIKRYAMECGVEVRVRRLVVDAVELTLTQVPEVRGRIVTTPNGRLLRRVGGDSQPLRGDALARFVRAHGQGSGEDEPLSGFGLSAVDLDALNRARAADDRPPVTRRRVPRALFDLGVAGSPGRVDGAGWSRAAAVLFAERPDEFIPGARVQLVRREGTGPGPGPVAAREECAGPLVNLLECCERFIGRHTRRYEVVTGLRRQALPEYPAPVVREAVLNALAHRDYNLSGATVDVTIWDDRLEVQSPGALPGHITEENMRYEHYSRNRRIMRVLKGLGLVEEYGDGVDRMFIEMEARLMEPPLFAAAADSVTVTLRNRFVVSVEDQVWLSLIRDTDLTVAERRILVAIRARGAISPRHVRAVLPGEDARALLSGAVAKGLLVRRGDRGGSRYELSDEIVLRAGSQSIESQRRKRQVLLDAMDREGSVSSVEGAALLGESVAAVRQMLRELLRSGEIRARGRTRGRRYFRL